MTASTVLLPLSMIATGRDSSLFAADIAAMRARLETAVMGKRILAVGGAGSIGSSTVMFLADLRPDALHVVDHDENALAELVRGLRSRASGLDVADFHTLPLDCGSPALRLWLHQLPPYDLVLNFAAIKHVRSEKDAFSTLQMLDTNLRKQARLMQWLAETGFRGRYFSVSTDKAANPSSMMGASKRAMEHVLFDEQLTSGLKATITSARFANVAFSNGSLLQSFENRLRRGEPLAAPRQTKRYFVSLAESGEICAIAACIAPHRTIVIPRLEPAHHLVYLEEVAAKFVQHHGYEPAFYDDEAEARSAVGREKVAGRWPILLTALDTSGEKPYEEFVAENEAPLEIGLPNLLAVAYQPATEGSVASLIDAIETIFEDANKTMRPQAPLKETLKHLIARVEPAFLRTHRDSDRNLDQRV